MKLLRYIIFVSILGSVFIIVYRQSDEKGLRRWWRCFKMAVIFAAIAAGLIPNSVEASEPYVPNNSPSTERVVKSNSGTFVRGGFKSDPDFKQYRVVSRIKENRALIEEAETMGRDQKAQRQSNSLINQMALGNENLGKGGKKLSGCKDVYYHRSGRARLFYRMNHEDKTIEILAKSSKKNQQVVIDILRKIY